jgi:hypothetical protein
LARHGGGETLVGIKRDPRLIAPAEAIGQ